ncbi:MAG TPA: hypothetical protein VFP45_07120 [Candidatus Nitrosotalea sp.]|nr:hypothetical protein [Candidatus Nitrosotalea sp.]
MINARKALVVLAIEKALLEIGKPTYNEVLGKLAQDYNCYLSDCYEHPEYLSRVLKDLYGQCRMEIIKSIEQFLVEMKEYEDIQGFIIKIRE